MEIMEPMQGKVPERQAAKRALPEAVDAFREGEASGRNDTKAAESIKGMLDHLYEQAEAARRQRLEQSDDETNGEWPGDDKENGTVVDIAHAANALVCISSLFSCSLIEAWERNTDPFIKRAWSFEELKAFIDKKVELGSRISDWVNPSSKREASEIDPFDEKKHTRLGRAFLIVHLTFRFQDLVSISSG